MVETQFNSQYFRKRKYLSWRAPIICSAIKKVFHPTSVMDLGCSIGDLVQGFNGLGVPAIGFDLAEDLFDWAEKETPIIIQDITEPLPTHSQFDLALCIETLRFIPNEKMEGLLSNLYEHSNRVLVGYGGDRKDYILSIFSDYGYTLLKDKMDELRESLEHWKSKPAIKALYHGGMYFVKQ